MQLKIYYRKLPVKYYLHKEGQFLDMNGRLGKRVIMGAENEAQVSAWSMEVLEEREQHNCTNAISFDDCLYQTLEKEMRSSTTQNCTVPWTKNNSMICTDPEDIEKAFSISWDRGTNQVIHIGNQSIFVRKIVKITYGETYKYCLL